MKCPEIKNMVSQYVDDELNPEERNVFVSHIKGCAGCREELEETRKVHQLFTSAERFEAPLGFATRVMARIEERERRPSFWAFFTLQPTFLRVVEVAFALVIFMIGALSGSMLVADRTTEQEPTVQQSFSLDFFETTPPGSIGGAYISLAGAGNER